jgi:hypothetical protein
MSCNPDRMLALLRPRFRTVPLAPVELIELLLHAEILAHAWQRSFDEKTGGGVPSPIAQRVLELVALAEEHNDNEEAAA